MLKVGEILYYTLPSMRDADGDGIYVNVNIDPLGASFIAYSNRVI